LDDNEDYCDWILRNALTQQSLFKIQFEKYTAPPVNIVADGFPSTAPVLVPVIHNNVAPIPVLHPLANGSLGSLLKEWTCFSRGTTCSREPT